MPALKLLASLANASFALGPALVFTCRACGQAPPGRCSWRLRWPPSSRVTSWPRAPTPPQGARLRHQLRESGWVYPIDAALSVVALVVAEELQRAPYAVLAVLPLLGLLRMFAGERRERLGKLLELNETYRGTALLLGDVISADSLATDMMISPCLA